MRVVSIIGHKNAGKTTLLVALAREFKRLNRRVATIKHSSIPPWWIATAPIPGAISTKAPPSAP